MPCVDTEQSDVNNIEGACEEEESMLSCKNILPVEMLGWCIYSLINRYMD